MTFTKYCLIITVAIMSLSMQNCSPKKLTKDSDTWVHINDAYLQKDFEKVIFMLKGYKGDSDYTEAQRLRYIGQSLFYLRRFDEAYSYFQKAIELDPSHQRHILNMAYFYTHKRELNKAITWFNKVLKKDAKNLQANSMLGKIYMEKKEYKMALKYLKIAIQQEKNSIEVLNDIMVSQGVLKMNSKSIQTADRILNIDPRNENALLSKGLIYTVKNDYPKSIEIFNKILIINPDNRKAIFNIATSYFFIKDYKKSKDYFKRYLRLDLNDNSKYKKLAIDKLKKIDIALTKK